MTELTFLLDLLLNHKLPMATRAAISQRIKEVEANLSNGYQVPRHAQEVRQAALKDLPAHLANQAPSTIAALQRHPDLVAEMAKPVEVVAQTPAAQQAMASRQDAINAAMAGKVEKGRTSPRKF